MKINFVKIAIIASIFILTYSNNIFACFFNKEKEKTEKIVYVNNNSNYEPGKRNLKLGNTYREAKNYDTAIRFLLKGLKMFESQRNIEEQYWFAVANEFLAYYYRDVNKIQQAQRYLTIAKSIFDNIIKQPDGSQFAINNIKLVEFESDLENFFKPSPNELKISIAIQNDSQTIDKENFNNSKDFFSNSAESFNNSKDFFNNSDDNINYSSEYKLNYDSRNLTGFPDDFTGNRVDNLSIANNQIEKFPERILFFETLKVLNASNNKIKIFPPLNRLKKLEFLDFSNNQITEIGSTIGELSNLEYLNLSNNPQLANISSEIYKLQNLLILDIRNTALPRHIIDELIGKLYLANVIYSPAPVPTVAAPAVVPAAIAPPVIDNNADDNWDDDFGDDDWDVGDWDEEDW